MTNILLAVESGSSSPDFPVLTSLIVVPFLGALVLALVPKARTEVHRLVALITTVITGALSLWVLGVFDKADPGFQLRGDDPNIWIDSLGVRWDLAVDGISLFMVVLTGILFPLAILGVQPEHSPKNYYAWIVVLEAGVMGVFLTLDLFLSLIHI